MLTFKAFLNEENKKQKPKVKIKPKPKPKPDVYIPLELGFPWRTKSRSRTLHETGHEEMWHVKSPNGYTLGSGISLGKAWQQAKYTKKNFYSGEGLSKSEVTIAKEYPKKSSIDSRMKAVKNRDALDQELASHYQWHDRDHTSHYQWHARDHISAITHYTGNGYRGVNKYLRNPPKNEDDPDYRRPDYDVSRAKETVEGLSSALRKHQTPKAFHVFSGTGRSPEKHITDEHRAKGYAPFEMHSFTSTSIDPETARSFAHDKHNEGSHVFVIHIPKGAHGGYVNHVSDNPGEHEFLLHHGAKIHMETKPRVKGGINYWHAHLVHDGVKDLTP